MKLNHLPVLIAIAVGAQLSSCSQSGTTSGDSTFVVLEEMGSDKGYDRKQVVQFVRDEAGVAGNNIGKVDVRASHAVVEVKADGEEKLAAYFNANGSGELTYVDASDFKFENATPASLQKAAGEGDHYGSDGPHGSGEGHSADPVKDPCHDGGN